MPCNWIVRYEQKSLLIPHLIHLFVIAHNFCISHTYFWKFLN
jgi:hypothetical protein